MPDQNNNNEFEEQKEEVEKSGNFRCGIYRRKIPTMIMRKSALSADVRKV